MDLNEELARLLARNWRLHDARDYDGIVANSTKLMIALGYDCMAAAKAAKIIKNIFVRADEAEEIAGLDHSRERAIYLQMAADCNKMDDLLNRPRNSRNELKWWYAVRHERRILASYYLFIDQLSKFGYCSLLSAIKAALALYRAGGAHDRKDWPAVELELVIVWSLALRDAESYFEF